MPIPRRAFTIAPPAFVLTAALSVRLLAAPVETATSPALASADALYTVWAQEQIEYNGIPGAAVGVVKGGDLVWARGYGVTQIGGSTPVTPRTIFRIGSVTKVFTATAVMQLRDRGLLHLDDPITTHLPWFRLAPSPETAGYRPITIRDLLTHTAGLPREGAFPYWTTHVFPTAQELRDAVMTQTAIHPPGEVYKYSNLGVALLGQILTQLSGKSYAETLRQQIFEPLGMRSSTAAPTAEDIQSLAAAYMRRRPDGIRRRHAYYDTGAFAPMAAVISNIEDLARFAALHLGHGPVAAVPVLATSTIQEMQRPHFVYPSWTGGRGLGFAVSRREGATYITHGGWIGGHRAEILLDPARDLAAIALTNADDASPGLFTRRALALFAPALEEKPTAPPPPTIPDPAWARFVGRYSDPWDSLYEVMILDGKLVLYEHGYPPEEDPEDSLNPLEPIGGPGTAKFKMGDGEMLEFEMDGTGQVVRVRRRWEYLVRQQVETP